MFGVALFTVPYGYSTLLKMLMSDYGYRPEIQDVTELTLPGQEYLWNFRISGNLRLLIREKPS